MNDATKYDGVFSHQRLDVYRTALQFARWAYGAAKGLPAGRSALRDQMLRACESVVLNIAEGAQQRSVAVARRHYRIALGSAAECDAALDLVQLYGLNDIDQGRTLVRRVGAMLRKLSR